MFTLSQNDLVLEKEINPDIFCDNIKYINDNFRIHEKIDRLIDVNNHFVRLLYEQEKSNNVLEEKIKNDSKFIEDLYKEKNKEIEDLRKTKDDEIEHLRKSKDDEIHKLKEDKDKLETNLDFTKSFNTYFPQKINEMKNQVTQNSFKIESFNDDEIINLINSIKSEEKFEEKIFDEVKNIVYENAKKNKSVKHLNIILAGPSGVGKSTLINSMLNFTNEECIDTGIGVPCTMGEPKYYESEKVSLLRLADSRGIEKGEYKMEDLNKSIETFIKGQLDSENPDYFVHCIWYCITGTRLEQTEMDTLKELSRIYKSNSIPIIVVYTRALSTVTIKEMEKFIKDNFTHDFIPVLAKKDIILDDIEVNPRGLDELKKISVLRAKEAVKSSCYEFNFLKTKKEVQEIIKKKKESLNSILNKIISDKINVMSEGKSKEELYDDLKNLLIYIISNHIYNTERKLVTLQSEDLIKDYSKKVIDKNMSKFDTLFNAFIENKSNELSNTFYNYQNNYWKSYLIDNKKSSSDFKNEAKQPLNEVTKNKAQVYFFKNLIENICTLYVKKFQEISEEIYNQIFEKEEFHNLIVKLIEKDFEEIDKNLKL